MDTPTSERYEVSYRVLSIALLWLAVTFAFAEPRDLSASEQLLAIDLYLVGGEWHLASEMCRQVYSRKLTFTAAAHRLGLCELARALTSSLARPQTVVNRWRQALAYLTIAATDSGHFEQWVASRFNYLRAATIYGGSNEIQRNIVAKRILELPS